jgi:pyridoxamine 5'-phosphate oxidase
MEPLSEHIRHLREDFTKGQLHERDLQPNPFLQFKTWMSQALASEISEVQAMTLSTVRADTRPESRIVYLREFDEQGYCFYTNYNSSKGKNLAQNPNVSLNFFWKELERQVRIEGSVEKVSAEQSDSYFNARPYDSKIGAWASAQSSKLNSREELEEKISNLKKQFTVDTIKRPEFWGGYRVVATRYEFWQGRQSRLHDRFAYELQLGNWKIDRLSP